MDGVVWVVLIDGLFERPSLASEPEAHDWVAAAEHVSPGTSYLLIRTGPDGAEARSGPYFKAGGPG